MKRKRFRIYIGSQYGGACFDYADNAILHARQCSRVVKLLPVELRKVVNGKEVPWKRWLAGREIEV